jgi:hypothetical protein
MLSDQEIADGLAARGVDVPEGASLQQRAFALRHPGATWVKLAGDRLLVVADRPSVPHAFDNGGVTLHAEREDVRDVQVPGDDLTTEQVRVGLHRELKLGARCDDGSALASDRHGRLFQIERDGSLRAEIHAVIGGVWVDFGALEHH